VAQPSDLHQIRIDALATMGYVANWRFVVEHLSYWSLFTAPSPLQHTWSLAIEEQFYLVWPLVFSAVAWMGRRRGPRHRTIATPRATTAQRILILSNGLAMASGVWGVVVYHLAGQNRDYYGTDTRAAAILLGAALASLMAIRGPAATRRGRVGVEVAGLVGVVVLALAWVRLAGTSALLYQGGLFVCSLAAVAVIAAATHPTKGPIARVLRVRPLVLLGMISYGFYLYHWPIFIWLANGTALRGWRLFGAQLALTLAVSIVSFIVVERPIRCGGPGRWPSCPPPPSWWWSRCWW
jgi:peptidoglycan/LPS O-acetylase OafA/YrhL